MANRIEIGFREGIRDALGEKIKKRIIDHLRIQVDSVKTYEVYTVEGNPSSRNTPLIGDSPAVLTG
jgi:phosphoribosylformylglycinamidine (FGAM) synthase PurS component